MRSGNARAFEQTLKRQGRRAAYAQRRYFYFELQPTTPRHGDRPFEIGHIDHTELDVEVVCSQHGPPTRATMDDDSHRCLFAPLPFTLSDIRRSELPILHDDPAGMCRGRIDACPRFVVTRRRSRSSTAPISKLSWPDTKFIKKTRPPAKARFGSVCERLFGTTNTQFIHNLRGNTQITRNVRQVTKATHQSDRRPGLLVAFTITFSIFLFEIYDTIGIPRLDRAQEMHISQVLKARASAQIE